MMARHLIIAGAQRSGTTYLYHVLDRHPDIAMAVPVRPEPKYFLREHIEPGRDAYVRALFGNARARWLGEKSTSYIEYPHVARRIADTIPDAHVIFMLRDPVARAISNYAFSRENGLETLDLEEALEREPHRAMHPAAGVSVSPFAYAGRGEYARHLDAWARCFPPDRMHLLVTERTVGNEAALRNLLRWLGLDDAAPLGPIAEKVNASSEVLPTDEGVSRAIARLREHFAPWNRLLRERHGVDTDSWT